MSILKKCRFLIAAALLFCLAGCFEINEDIDIKPGGSGQLSIHTDASQMLDMLQSFMSSDEMAKKLPSKKLDTVIQMSSLVDSAKDPNGDKKKLLKDGTMHMNLNLDQKVFKTDMQVPFSSQANLQKVYMSMNDQSLGMANMAKMMSGATDSASAHPLDGPAPEDPMAGMGGGQMPDMGNMNSIYSFESRDGFLSRKLDQGKWKSLQENAQFSQMQSLQSMGISIPYSLTVHLPRPAKKVSNPAATLSADKKTVTLKYNMAEVFQHPEKFEYSITY
jgi:hypothetical protein